MNADAPRPAGARAPQRAWVLNFDADEELASPRSYTPRAEVRARFPALAARVGPLLGEGDVLVDGGDAAGLEGRAFCPTPRALAALAAAGARVPAAPSLDVLRAVNDRAFHAALGLGLPGAVFARTADEALAAIAAPSPTGSWLAKRAFGFAGRGRRVFAATDIDANARGWIGRALQSGGIEITPLCERLADFGMHGFVAMSDAITLGEPTVQVIDAAGAWQATRLARTDGRATAARHHGQATAERADQATTEREAHLDATERDEGLAASGSDENLAAPHRQESLAVTHRQESLGATHRDEAQATASGIDDLGATEHEALRREAERIAVALRDAGYFGPFGIDAFRWRAPDGVTRFHARCDINARYTMGWATGMGAARPDLLRAVT